MTKFSTTDGAQHPAGTLHPKKPRPADIFIEGPNNLPDIADPRWDQPGVYPMPRTGLVKDPARMAEGMRIGNEWYCGLWRKRWEAAGKELKIAHLLIPALMPDEVPFRLADDPRDAPHCGVYYRHGINDAAAWSNAWASTYAASVKREGLAPVTALLSDFEAMPNTDGMGPQGPLTNDPGQGWWLRAMRDNRVSLPEEFKGIGQSLRRWAQIADRGTLLNGDKIPAIQPRVSGPQCWDSLATAYEAQDAASYNAYARAFGPIAAALGCRYGEWRCYSRSRAHPVLNNPGQYKYNLQGDFPLGLQIPVNYCRTEAAMSDEVYAQQTPDVRQPTLDNWSALGERVGPPWPAKMSRYERGLYAMFAVNTANAQAMHLANPDVPLFPCIMCDFDGGYNQDPWTPAGGNDGFDSLRCELMAQYLYDLRFCNLAGTWYWAPDWDSRPVVRERVWKFIAAYRAKF